MSLIDTSVVGARSSVQLAALGPGTALCDNLAYVYTFLASVTTALVATARAEKKPAAGDEAVSTGCVLSTALGLATTALLLVKGKDLLILFLGGASAAASEVSKHYQNRITLCT
jgi:Na+-driven multidrug efflux pump